MIFFFKLQRWKAAVTCSNITITHYLLFSLIGDVHLTDKEIHDRDLEWLRSSSGIKFSDIYT